MIIIVYEAQKNPQHSKLIKDEKYKKKVDIKKTYTGCSSPLLNTNLYNRISSSLSGKHHRTILRKNLSGMAT